MACQLLEVCAAFLCLLLFNFLLYHEYKKERKLTLLDTVYPVTTGRPQRAGEESDSAFLHDSQRECQQSSDLCPG